MNSTNPYEPLPFFHRPSVHGGSVLGWRRAIVGGDAMPSGHPRGIIGVAARTAAALAALLAAVTFAVTPAVAAQAVDLELVLAADGSGSIDDEELRLQREGYAAAVTDESVLSAIQSGPVGAIALAYVEWGGPGSQHTVVDWMVIRDAVSARAFAERLVAAPRMATGYNSISGAIDYAANLIRTNDIQGARRMIDVSGDGPNIGGRPVQAARDEAVLDGITVNALVVASPNSNGLAPGFGGARGMDLVAHYERDVIGGFGAFVMTADEERSFADAVLEKLLREIVASR